MRLAFWRKEERASPENPSTNLSNPAAWLTSLFSQKTHSDIDVNEQNALAQATVFSCIALISDMVSSLPVHVHERVQVNGKTTRRIASGHPVDGLLHFEPNEFMSANTFINVLTGHLESWGNAYALIERDGAERPRSLVPLLPDRTFPERKNGRLVYNTQIDQDSKRITIQIDSSDVLHLSGLGWDGMKGYSKIGMMRESIGLSMAAQAFGSRFFANDARPGIVVEHPMRLGDVAHKNLKNSLMENYSGIKNSHRPLILEEGMKLHEVGIPPEDAQFLQTRQFQRSEICGMFRVPPHLVGDVSSSTSWGTGIEQQNIAFVQYTIGPVLKRWESEINRKLFGINNRGRFYAKFNVEGLLRGDTASRYSAYESAITKSGWMNRNEARELEDLNPVDGLDEYLVPMNMTTSDRVGEDDAPTDAE